MKQGLVYFLTALLSCGLLSGCSTEWGQLSPEEPTEESLIQQEIKVMPNNVLQFGEIFTYYPDQADGHFLITVDDVQVIQDASECPPAEEFYSDMLTAYPGGVQTNYFYDDWFTEGGAYDQGARLLKVEVSVTNVDAVGWPNNGLLDSTTGLFNAPDIFVVSNIISLVDMSVVRGPLQDQYYEGPSCIYSSTYKQYFQEEDHSTPGPDQHAVQLPPGETITFTQIFPIHGDKNREAKDLSMQWLSVNGQSYVKTGIFIDPRLGED